jgi:hypothetical protein
MKTATTTVKQIRAKAFQSIMDKIDRTCNDAWFMPMDDNRSNFVYEKSSEINRLIYVCFESGALTVKQHDELKRLNMFVTDSCGKHHGECSSITFDGYYTTR